MGWLLTLWLSFPLPGDVMEVKMWFSRKSYCTFAEEKFLENPILFSRGSASAQEVVVRDHQCRRLRKEETALIPKHMRK